MGRKKKEQAPESTPAANETNPAANEKAPEVKAEPKAPAKPKKNPAIMAFAIGILPGFISDLDAADMAKEALEYAAAMAELADSNSVRSELAMGAIQNHIKGGATPSEAAKMAFAVADEIIKIH